VAVSHARNGCVVRGRAAESHCHFAEPGNTVALLTFVEIQFDQPMLPPADAIPCVVSVVSMKSPGAICSVQYNPTNHTFRIPLLALATECGSRWSGTRSKFRPC
jgi:hypothetical protein